MGSDMMARDDAQADDAVLNMLARRRSVPAARLAAPGPTLAQLETMLTLAARVRDHGALAPWRFIVVEGEARTALAGRLAAACIAEARDAPAQEQAQKTVQKLKWLFGTPPLVIVVVSRPDATAKIPVQEQVLSAGAVCMNLMTAATVLGFGTNWLTGWASANPAARPILGLAEGESVAGVIPVGTATEQPAERPRPTLSAIVTRV